MTGPRRGGSSQSDLATRLREVNERLVVSIVHEHEQADVAEQKRAQLSALLEALAEGVVIARRSGEVVLSNRAACRILDVDMAAEAAALLEDDSVVFPELRLPDKISLPPNARPLARALRGERFEDAELFIERPDGELRRVLSSGTCIHDAAGVALAIVVLRDVTDVWRLEQQREEYLALISHDLRGPITAINMLANSLREAMHDEGIDERITDRIDRIESNAARMEAMIRELLDATTLEQHAGSNQRVPYALGAIVDDVITGMDEHARTRVVDESGEDLIVFADAQALARAIANLVGNALKYSKARVHIRTEIIGAHVSLLVIDEGPGIAAVDVPLLFQRYYRAASARPVGGLGLGLYIVRLVAEAHGGTVSVTSELGSGSTFRLTLPLAAHAR